MSDTPRPLDSESEVNGRIRQLESELAASYAVRDKLEGKLALRDAECAELRKDAELYRCMREFFPEAPSEEALVILLEKKP
jgi:hypothetical protein